MQTNQSLSRPLPDPRAPVSALPPGLQATILHLACALVAWQLTGFAQGITAWPFLEALLAVCGGLLLGMAPWWTVINAVFVPGLYVAHAVDIAPAWALGAFSVLLLLYWGVGATQVPLFLSTRAAIQTLRGLLPKTPRPALLDIGCGTGGVISSLAAGCGDGRFDGIECAPLPWLLAWLRMLGDRTRCAVRCGDFWRCEFTPYDVVYAYLSPVPMARVWEKACREMRPGTLLVSNTFAVPGVVADEVIPLDDAWGGALFIYRM